MEGAAKHVPKERHRGVSFVLKDKCSLLTRFLATYMKCAYSKRRGKTQTMGDRRSVSGAESLKELGARISTHSQE